MGLGSPTRSTKIVADALSSNLSRDLANSAGTTYLQFRLGMTPKLGMVWRDITRGWIMLVGINAAIIALSGRSLLLSAVVAGCGAVLIGFTIAYLMLFLHEAGHYNLHSDKKWNDLICNVLVSGIVGIDVQDYRLIHWEHHRYFGSPMDTEISYRDPLNIRFLVETMIGIRSARVALAGRKKLNQLEGAKSAARIHVLVSGLVFNGGYLALLLYFRQWPAVFSWICGILIFFPFFAALRQLLEHRDELIELGAETARALCVATHRIFGDGLIASTFGAAGFNRHLLHHWDPQISYSRLRDVEDFLLETEGADYLRERQTTYARAFGHLFHAVWR